MNYKRIPSGMNDRVSTAIMIYRLEVDSSSRDDGARESITVVNLDTLHYW